MTLTGAVVGVSPGAGARSNHRQHEDDRALDQPEPEERRRITVGGDDCADRDDGQGRTRAEAGRCEAHRQTTAIGKPFHRIADAGRIDRAGAGAGNAGREIEYPELVGVGVEDPADRDQHAADSDHELRAEAIGQPALDRGQPGFKRDKEAEGDLDVGDGPSMRLFDGVDKQRPAVLQVGDHHHTDDADQQLDPAE